MKDFVITAKNNPKIKEIKGLLTSSKDRKNNGLFVLEGVRLCCEFAFMFLAFPLYVVYAALYGIFAAITVALGFRAGFCFSAGATDLIFSASLPAAANTWLIIPLGIAAFVVFYLVFKFAITKWDLKTPGREDDQEGEMKIELANNELSSTNCSD